MNNKQFLYKQSDESAMEYIGRLCTLKDKGEITMSWINLADWLNMQLCLRYSESWYRKGYKNGDFRFSSNISVGSTDSSESQINQLIFEEDLNSPEVESITTTAVGECCNGKCDECEDFEDCIQGYEQYLADKEVEVNEKLQEMRKERIKLADERTQNNALLRRLTREDTIKEIAFEYAEKMNKELKLPLFEYENWNHNYNGDLREGILLLSDWHYGMVCDNPWNKFDTDICKKRVNNLLHKVIAKLRQENIDKLTVLNLSDLIAGRIHTQIRIQSRIDVITQTMEVAEILAEFLQALSKYCYIDYYDALDNHSRIEPDKKESMDLESLARIIPWYLVSRLKDNDRITICNNEFGPDIITCNVLGHNIIAVHGDHDSPVNGLDKLTLMTHRHYDLFCLAHRHHMHMDEKNHTVVIGNSSLMGTDSYAEKLRLSTDPSQTLIIVTRDNPCDEIHRILVR